MSDGHACYEVDVYVDSTGRYHLPLVYNPHGGPPRAYDFSDGNDEPVIGHMVTVWRSGHEADKVVFARAYEALTEAGFEVKKPRWYKPNPDTV